MYVAAIDPGQTTGLVIARMRIESNTVWLRRDALESCTHPLDVLRLIDKAGTDYIVMERKASNGNTAGTVPYDRILFGLERQGFDHTGHFLAKPGFVHIISPGLWKPVIKARNYDLSAWHAQTLHEKDAIGLLYYFVYLNYATKEIQYG